MSVPWPIHINIPHLWTTIGVLAVVGGVIANVELPYITISAGVIYFYLYIWSFNRLSNWGYLYWMWFAALCLSVFMSSVLTPTMPQIVWRSNMALLAAIFLAGIIAIGFTSTNIRWLYRLITILLTALGIMALWAVFPPYLTALAHPPEGGRISPQTPWPERTGHPAKFSVIANKGYVNTHVVGGTCPTGSWGQGGKVYSTAMITTSCTVEFNFSKSLPVSPAITPINLATKPVPKTVPAVSLSRKPSIKMAKPQQAIKKFCWECLPSRGGWRAALPQLMLSERVVKATIPKHVSKKFCWECLPNRGGWRAALPQLIKPLSWTEWLVNLLGPFTYRVAIGSSFAAMHRLGNNYLVVPNDLLFGAILTVMLLVTMLGDKQRLWRWLAVLGLIIWFLIALLYESRVVLLALLVNVLFFWHLRYLSLVLLVSVPLVTLLNILMGLPLWWHKLSAIFTWVSRLPLWYGAWFMFMDAPWFGHGFDSFRMLGRGYVNQAQQLLPIWMQINSALTPPWPHNIYLEVLAERGMWGFLVLCSFLLAIMRYCCYNTLLYNKINDRVLHIQASKAMLLTVVLVGWFDASLNRLWFMVVLAVVAGCVGVIVTHDEHGTVASERGGVS